MFADLILWPLLVVVGLIAVLAGCLLLESILSRKQTRGQQPVRRRARFVQTIRSTIRLRRDKESDNPNDGVKSSGKPE
jgi:hypothetical protein